MIAAFAAVTANGTESRVLANEGDDVIFTDVFTQVGVTLINNVVLVCPSDAFYFVHYRLRQRTNQEGPPCTMALFVGQDVIEVSFQQVDLKTGYRLYDFLQRFTFIIARMMLHVAFCECLLN